MLFGSGKGQDIGIDSLEREVGTLFDKKVEKFSSKAAKISETIERTKKEFVYACDEFEKLDEDPDLEFKRWLSPNFIKTQKGAYARALKRIFGNYATPKAQVSYSAYSAELASVEGTMRDILDTNGRNRDVIHAYSRYLGRFKMLQSLMEGEIAKLKLELGRVATEFNEYNEIMEALAKLKAAQYEIGFLGNELNSLGEGRSKKDEGDGNITANLEKSAVEKRNELDAVRSEIDGISSRITGLVLPLGKAARIYDHSAMRKEKLSDIVENPLEYLNSGEQFQKFSETLEGLKESITKHRIELKKPDETLELISKIKGAKIYEDVEEKTVLESKKRVLEGEIAFLDNETGRKIAEVESKKALAEKAEGMRSTMHELDRTIDETKGTVEGLILRYYRKKVNVIL